MGGSQNAKTVRMQTQAGSRFRDRAYGIAAGTSSDAAPTRARRGVTMRLAPVKPPSRRDQTWLGGKHSTKMVRISSEGRGGGDGHLPSASQSNHFSQPPFLSPLHQQGRPG